MARVKLDLDYTSVRSPINGRIGRALVTEGALVGQGEATHMATVQQLDPVYADFTQSAGDLQQLRRDLESGALEQVEPDAAKVRLVLEHKELAYEVLWNCVRILSVRLRETNEKLTFLTTSGKF